jgi:two-component system, NtrC family, response regulator HupR/HoxA
MTDETTAAAERGDGAAAPRGAAPAQTVLVVDDETGARDLIARWLESSGYTVTTAASAEEALGRLQDQPSAVALCDIRMPGRDGLWLAGRIREQ